MPRYTLYRGDSAAHADATEHIRSTGARVIASRPGLALIKATDTVAEQLRDSLPDWRVTKEIKAAIPTPRTKMPAIRKK